MTGASTIPDDDPLAIEAMKAIRGGDVPRLRRLLADNPQLAGTQIADVRCDDTRSLLHVPADGPGHFPNGSEVVRTIAAAGSDLDARGAGTIGETPLQGPSVSASPAAAAAARRRQPIFSASSTMIPSGPRT